MKKDTSDLLLRLAAAKLRQMGNEFSSDRFFDRYGDGPLMLSIAGRIDAYLEGKPRASLSRDD